MSRFGPLLRDKIMTSRVHPCFSFLPMHGSKTNAGTVSEHATLGYHPSVQYLNLRHHPNNVNFSNSERPSATP
jgi:hypothetical protein